MLEPKFLDQLPPRLRSRWRGNFAAFAVIAACVLVPPRCGPAFIIRRYRATEVRRPAWSYAMCATMIAAFGYPIVAGWLRLDFENDAALSFFAGCFLYVIFICVERKIMLPSIFGSQRSNTLRDWRAVREAQRQTRTDTRAEIDALMNPKRPSPP